MSLLLRFAGASRVPSQAAYPSLSRYIYSPTLRPPATAGPGLNSQFRETTAPTLSPEKFKDIIYGENDDYGGLIPEKHQERATLKPSKPEELWAVKSPKQFVLQPPPNHLIGRSMLVVGYDVSRAWSGLQGILKINNIRTELRLTDRHEKKGAKRRRLRALRWRRKFADEVKTKVKLVNEIRLRDRMWGASRH